MSFQDRKEKIVKEFNELPDWEKRYELLIKKAKASPTLPDEMKTEESKVKGCQSQVWLHVQLKADKTLVLRGDSDALLVKGLVAVNLELFNGLTATEILQADLGFIREIGFDSYLSPSRANGLQAMLKQIKYFAIAFSQLS